MSMTFPAFGPGFPVVLGQLLAEVDYRATGTLSTGATANWVAFPSLPSLVFVCPPSGQVDVAFESLVVATQTGGGGSLAFITHGTTTVFGCARFASASTTRAIIPGFRQRVTGLTPGNTYTIDLAGENNTGTDGMSLFVGAQTTSPPSVTTYACPVNLKAFAA